MLQSWILSSAARTADSKSPSLCVCDYCMNWCCTHCSLWSWFHSFVARFVCSTDRNLIPHQVFLSFSLSSTLLSSLPQFFASSQSTVSFSCSCCCVQTDWLLCFGWRANPDSHSSDAKIFITFNLNAMCKLWCEIDCYHPVHLQWCKSQIRNSMRTGRKRHEIRIGIVSESGDSTRHPFRPDSRQVRLIIGVESLSNKIITLFSQAKRMVERLIN